MTKSWREQYGEPDIPQRANVAGCKYLLEEELRKNNGDSFSKYVTEKAAEYALTIYCKQLIHLTYERRETGQLTGLLAVNEALREIVGTKDKKDPSFQTFSAMHSVYTKAGYEAYMDKGPFPFIVDLFYATAHEQGLNGSAVTADIRKENFKPFLD